MKRFKVSSFRPRNRRLLISLLKEEEKAAGIVLPEEYTNKKNRHSLAKVMDTSPDCSKDFLSAVNLHVVVESQMVEEVKIADQTFETVLENYVLGILEIE